MMEMGTWCMREVERGRWRDETEDLAGIGAAPATDLGPWLCWALAIYPFLTTELVMSTGRWPSHKRQKLLATFLLNYHLKHLTNQ